MWLNGYLIFVIVQTNTSKMQTAINTKTLFYLRGKITNEREKNDYYGC